jgi:hypothetical protein
MASSGSRSTPTLGCSPASAWLSPGRGDTARRLGGFRQARGWPHKRIRSPKAPRLARHSASVCYAGLGPSSECRASETTVAVPERRRVSPIETPMPPRGGTAPVGPRPASLCPWPLLQLSNLGEAACDAMGPTNRIRVSTGHVRRDKALLESRRLPCSGGVPHRATWWSTSGLCFGLPSAHAGRRSSTS